MFRALKKSLARGTGNKFLFVLSPPYCGSTLLCQLLCTCRDVSINNREGTMEGQTLPGVRETMFVEQRWKADYCFDWKRVKEIWLRHWDTSRSILLEKSPANIIRSAEIQRAFTPSYFIVLWRNPYAHCESLIRRNANCPRQAASFAIRCLKLQKANRQLRNAMSLSYESLTNDPGQFVSDASVFLPELKGIDCSRAFDAHNLRNKPSRIENLNAEKISSLGARSLAGINEVFGRHRDLIGEFGYEILSPQEH